MGMLGMPGVVGGPTGAIYHVSAGFFFLAMFLLHTGLFGSWFLAFSRLFRSWFLSLSRLFSLCGLFWGGFLAFGGLLRLLLPFAFTWRWRHDNGEVRLHLARLRRTNLGGFGSRGLLGDRRGVVILAAVVVGRVSQREAR